MEEFDRNEERQTGKDEMNLIEYPIALLSKRQIAGKNTLEFTDTITGEYGTPVKREWTVTGSEKYGLPVAGDEDVFMALMAAGKEQGFANRKIYFSRYRLLKIMQWRDTGENYKRVEGAIDRFKTVGIKAVNAFWDNERKGYVTKHFGIIDDYELFDSKQREARGQGHLAISYVRLSEVLFESIQAGYIKTIDITTYYKLESAIAKRLYRYLDKKKYDGKNYFTINLFTLTELHLGLKGTKYPSQIKQQIDPAHEELRKAGFLASWKYEKTTEGKSEKVTYTFAEKKKALPVPSAQKSGDSDPLLEKLLQIGISNGAAERLMRKYPREEIEAQIKALPYRNAENPAALLHQAIKEKWPLPETLLKEEHRMERRSAEQARQEAEARVREERRQKIESYILALTPAELAELHQEAKAKARQECPGVYKDRDVPEHIIRGYVSEMAGERIKK